ncbi:peptidase S9 [Wenjunlia vitaminophila]|uniref:Peptidase S9 n=1 Tax=Wenjunlia vitaminophila TaxID=76728 RepID=A0A0T6LYA4_WENVI|nr:alpha/beta fold hydrolase [Wenjunlia vitaminophila]KRV50960.1 peptidase S9 [Wenjunlia vitaminophila]
MADATVFHDLSAFVALPRLTGLALSPDGTRLVTSATELSPDGTRHVPVLWEVDPTGRADAVRLTNSDRGASAPAFLPDGSLLFLTDRKAPGQEAEADGAGEGRRALWRLPLRGEATRLVARAGGIDDYAVAGGSGHLAFAASLLPGAQDAEDDAKRRADRRSAGVSAILHESGPVRFWDADLGPGVPHVFVTGPADGAGHGRTVDVGERGPIATGLALSPDGSLVAYVSLESGPPHDLSAALVVADATTGQRVAQLGSPEHTFSEPVFTRDGRSVVCVRGVRNTREAPGDVTLWRLDLDPAGPEGGAGWDLTPDLDLWPVAPVPAATGDVFFTADDHGHRPVFRLRPDGSRTRLTRSGCYTDVVVSPDGGTVYALHSTVDSPPRPVRLDADGVDQEPVPLRAPGGPVALPGSLTEVHTTADDGVALRGWLALPDRARADRPAPLLVFVHGGPQTSWNAWHWRWNPWPAVARGYAVLLPDPALSTGYGQHHHQRGWSGWGQQPYRDVLALTDAAVARGDIDAERTGLLGGSYGGYMANWVAGHTDRFRAIVSHASLWNLAGFAGDTDCPGDFSRIFGRPGESGERYQENSPHLHAEKINTPMLVIHGARDYRVPVGEAMALWRELQRLRVPAKYLYFPDENHWVLSPNNARVWYSTVLNFLDHHVLDHEWQRPDLL